MTIEALRLVRLTKETRVNGVCLPSSPVPSFRWNQLTSLFSGYWGEEGGKFMFVSGYHNVFPLSQQQRPVAASSFPAIPLSLSLILPFIVSGEVEEKEGHS